MARAARRIGALTLACCVAALPFLRGHQRAASPRDCLYGGGAADGRPPRNHRCLVGWARDRDLEDGWACPTCLARAKEVKVGISDVDDRVLADVNQGHVECPQQPV